MFKRLYEYTGAIDHVPRLFFMKKPSTTRTHTETWVAPDRRHEAIICTKADVAGNALGAVVNVAHATALPILCVLCLSSSPPPQCSPPLPRPTPRICKGAAVICTGFVAQRCCSFLPSHVRTLDRWTSSGTDPCELTPVASAKAYVDSLQLF